MSIKKEIDVCIAADQSGSLENEAEAINQGIADMIKEITKNPYFHGYKVHIALYGFNDEMKKHIDFKAVESISENAIKLEFSGQTNPGPALESLAEKSIARYESWKAGDCEASHPILIFFSDGQPYPVEKYMKSFCQAASAIKKYEADRKLLVICAGYGDANIDNLNLLTAYPERVVSIEGGRIDKLYKFFSYIIPQTLTAAVTDSFNSMADMFRFFAMS